VKTKKRRFLVASLEVDKQGESKAKKYQLDKWLKGKVKTIKLIILKKSYEDSFVFFVGRLNFLKLF
jgi:hypothetical protein